MLSCSTASLIPRNGVVGAIFDVLDDDIISLLEDDRSQLPVTVLLVHAYAVAKKASRTAAHPPPPRCRHCLKAMELAMAEGNVRTQIG